MIKSFISYLVAIFFTLFSFGCKEDILSPSILIEHSDKEWRTEEDKLELFKKLGVKYISTIEFSSDCRHLGRIEPQELIGSISRLTDAQRAEALDVIMSNKYPNTYIKWISDEVGYGLFADADIDESKIISVYAGVVDKSSEGGTVFTWNYPSSGSINGSSYSVSSNFKGNESRFINDNPKDRSKINLRQEMIYVPVDGGKGYYLIGYFSNRKIAKGEELLISYGDAYWRSRPSVEL
jgi:hypothetical protein